MRIFHNVNNISQINEFMKNPVNKLFLLIYMEGCGPCNATRPNWEMLYKHFKNKKFHKYNNIAIADIEQTHLSNLNFITFEIAGFPTMKMITNNGKTHTNYEDENTIAVKDRSTKSFIQWILNKKGKNTKKRKNRKNKNSRKHKQTQRNI